MNSLEWSIIQLLFLMCGFVGLVLFVVIAPLVLISANIHAARKKPQEKNNSTLAAEPQPTAPAVMVSQDDGRVIAMAAPVPPPVVPPAVTPQKQGFHPLVNFGLQVLGKVAVGAVMSHLKHPHHKK